MDKILVGMSITDKIGPHGLVHSRERCRKLSMVLSYSEDGNSHGDDNGSKEQEALYITHNSVPAVDDTPV